MLFYSSGSRGGGGGGAIPPSPLKLKIHSILCMGVLGDNTICIAIHMQVFLKLSARACVSSMAESMAGLSKKAKFKNIQTVRVSFRTLFAISIGHVAIGVLQLLRSFGGFPTQKALASGAPPQTPMGELPALPHTP